MDPIVSSYLILLLSQEVIDGFLSLSTYLIHPYHEAFAADRTFAIDF